MIIKEKRNEKNQIHQRMPFYQEVISELDVPVRMVELHAAIVDIDVDASEDPTKKNYDNGIVFEEEGDGYEVTVADTEADKFIGKWEATSGNSHYLFGNLDLNIQKDGKWTGNITNEDLNGTWEEKDGGIYLDGDVFKGQLNFSDSGTLLLQYLPFKDSTEPVIIVLTEKK